MATQPFVALFAGHIIKLNEKSNRYILMMNIYLVLFYTSHARSRILVITVAGYRRVGSTLLCLHKVFCLQISKHRLARLVL